MSKTAPQISSFTPLASPYAQGDTTSTEHSTIARLLNGISSNNLNQLPDGATQESFFGMTKAHVTQFYSDLSAHSRQNDRLYDVRKQLEHLSNDELGVLMQLISRDGYNTTSAHILADRNDKNAYYGSDVFNRDLRQQRYVRDLAIEKELGETAEEAKFFYNVFKFFPTITPHPTKDKNDLGETLYRQRIRIIDTFAPEHRIEALAKNDQEVLTHRVTPDKKDDFTKETDDALASQVEILEGSLNWIEDKQDALNKVHGHGIVDFMADDMHMDIGTRRWQGGDADGKPIPAPALFALRVKGARKGLKMYMEMMNGHQELTDQYNVFRQLLVQMNAIDLSELEKMKTTSENPELFESAIKQFSDAFTKTPYKGQTFTTGPDLTKTVMKDLQEKADTLIHDPISEDAGKSARRAFFMHKQVGIGVGRQEIRHNGEDFETIFDNLFEHLQEQGVTEKFTDDKKFSEMEPKLQAVYLKRFMAEHSPQDVKQWLYEANNDGWSREILERFDVIHSCYNHNRMGFAIIAEAKPSSAVLQQVMADAFEIKNMTHCPLNEEEKTIRMAAESLGLYSEVFGAQNLLSKIENSEQSNTSLPPLFYAVMDPQSDSQKQYGLNIRWLQRATDQELIDRAITPLLDQIKSNGLTEEQTEKLKGQLVPVLRKIGTGASSARGGFSPKVVPRLFLNALQDNGFDLDNLPDEIRPVLKQMVCFVSTTIQGRDVGMRMGTQESVQDLIEGVERECRAACLVIDGKLQNTSHLVVPPAPNYSKKMRKAIEIAGETARSTYEEMRTVKSIDKDTFGKPMLDLFLEKVGALTIAAFTNVGARPPARESSSKILKKIIQKASTIKARAIGSNNMIATSEAHFDGSYTMGKDLTTLRDMYKDGDIDLHDIDMLKDDPFFIQQMMPNAIVALASADYEHSFDALSNGDGKKCTVQKIIEAQENDWKDLDETTRFAAVLAYDALMATAAIEALQDGPTLIRGRQTIRKIFGRAAQGVMPARGFELSDKEMIYKVYNPSDRINELKFGEKTKTLFPEIDNLTEEKNKTRLSRAIVHEVERRVDMIDNDPDNLNKIDPKSDEGKSFLHHVACASRNMGPKNMESLLGRWGFGANPTPVFDRILNHFPAIAQKIEQQIQYPANDNNSPAGFTHR